MSKHIPKMIVFSLDRPNKPVSDQDMELVKSMLFNSGLISRPAIGVYKGEVERSWIVETETEHESDLIKSIARAYNQESVLSVDLATHDATLEFLLEDFLVKKDMIGKLYKSDKIDKQNMTLDLNSLTVYVVR